MALKVEVSCYARRQVTNAAVTGGSHTATHTATDRTSVNHNEHCRCDHHW
ncbi:hypothetical protein AB0H57_24365 [Micromonospora sp. NPDC050686]